MPDVAVSNTITAPAQDKGAFPYSRQLLLTACLSLHCHVAWCCAALFCVVSSRSSLHSPPKLCAPWPVTARPYGCMLCRALSGGPALCWRAPVCVHTASYQHAPLYAHLERVDEEDKREMKGERRELTVAMRTAIILLGCTSPRLDYFLPLAECILIVNRYLID